MLVEERVWRSFHCAAGCTGVRHGCSDVTFRKPNVLAMKKVAVFGNAGAGKSGGEDMGSEKKIDDERFGSRKADGTNRQEDEGKRDAPGEGSDPVQNR